MKIILIFSIFLFLGPACAQKNADTDVLSAIHSYTLGDFYGSNEALDAAVDQSLSALTPAQKVGQMIVAAAGRLGKPDTTIERLLRNEMLGGVLLLNGSVEGFKAKIANFNGINASAGGLPLIYSADAEPSLINRKIEGTAKVPKTSEIQSPEHSRRVALTISQDLKNIGIQYNYAPVLDLSVSNAAITNRSYGANPDSVIGKAMAFMEASREAGIITTAKHFPGHGLVKGDSHHQLVYIDGNFKEVDVYRPLIERGLLSIMIGHIAVENNGRFDTEGAPASCSKAIVTDLLQNEMGFRGLIVTDAMNMGAVSNLENAALEAVKAGCDIILMPLDEAALIDRVVELYERDPALRAQVDGSARKIIRMKYCLGLL